MIMHEIMEVKKMEKEMNYLREEARKRKEASKSLERAGYFAEAKMQYDAYCEILDEISVLRRSMKKANA